MLTAPRRAVVAVLLLGVALGQLVGPAEAHHGGRPIGSFSSCLRPSGVVRCTSVGDNPTHHVYFDATLTDELAVALRDTMEGDYEPTKLTMVVDEEFTDRTDVTAISENFGENGAAGWVACPLDAAQGFNSAGHRWCRGQELFFNLNPRYAIFFDDEGSREHVACHELGHTIGLRHWGNPPESQGPAAQTCMNSNTPNGPTTLHQIDRDHINAYAYERWARPKLPRFMLLSQGTTSGVQASEIEPAGTLSQMTVAADAVVLGRVTAVSPGRSFGGASGHPLHYASVTVLPLTLLAGRAPMTPITLEVPLFDGPGTIEELESVIGMEAIFLLRAKTDGPYWRLTNFGAVLVNEGGVARATAGPPAIEALDGLGFSEAMRRVRAAGR